MRLGVGWFASPVAALTLLALLFAVGGSAGQTLSGVPLGTGTNDFGRNIAVGPDDSVYLNIDEWAQGSAQSKQKIVKANQYLNVTVWEVSIFSTGYWAYTSQDSPSVSPDGTGVYFLSATVGLSTITPGGTAYSGGYDIYLQRFSSTNGNLEWTTQIAGTANNEYSAAITVDQTSGEIFVTGKVESAACGTHGGGEDFVIAKAQSGGTLSYCVQYGQAGFDRPASIAVSSTHIYLMAWTNSNWAPTSNVGYDCFFVGKFDKLDGSYVGHVQDGHWASDVPTRVFVEPGAASIVVVGYAGAADWGGFMNYFGGGDGLMVRLDANNFSRLNGKSLGTTGEETFDNGCWTSRGLFLVGKTNGIYVPGDLSSGSYDAAGVLFATGTTTVLESFQLGDIYKDYFLSCAEDSKGNIFALGYYEAGPVNKYFITRLTPKPACGVGHYYDKYQTWNQCLPCPAGHVNGVVGSFTCTECNDGFVPDSTSSACVQCPAGTFDNTTSCAPCPPGKSSVAGSLACYECPAGYAQSGVICAVCEVGTYADTIGSSSCKACPNKSTTLQEASNSLSLCVCESTQYGDPTGNPSTECKSCPSDARCDGGKDPVPINGFALVASDPENVARCMPRSACEGVTSACADDYIGDYCTECSEGRFRGPMQAACIKCPQEGLGAVGAGTTFITLIAATAIGVGLLVYDETHAILKDTMEDYEDWTRGIGSTPLALLCLWYRMWPNILLVVSVGSAMSAAQPYFSSMAATVLVGPGAVLAYLPCMGVRLPHAALYTLRTVAFPILILVVAAAGGVIVGFLREARLYKVRLEAERKKDENFEKETLNARMALAILGGGARVTLRTFHVGYAMLAVAALEPLRCMEVESGVWRMFSAPNLQCFVLHDTDWAVTLAVGLVVLPLLVGYWMLSVVLYIMLHTSKGITKDGAFGRSMEVISGFMFSPYQDGMKGWEILRLAFHLILPMCCVVFCGSLYDQAVAMELVMLLYLVLLSTFRPYESTIEDFSELLMTLGVQVLHSSLVMSRDAEGNEISDLGRWFMVVLSCVAGVYVIFVHPVGVVVAMVIRSVSVKFGYDPSVSIISAIGTYIGNIFQSNDSYETPTSQGEKFGNDDSAAMETAVIKECHKLERTVEDLRIKLKLKRTGG